MANVFDVAEFFIQLANQSEDDQMTNLKLNKLLYYAQGVFLARTGKPLFPDSIEAWPLGPVVPDIYHRYKVCGKSPIASSENEIDCSRFNQEELDTLFDVMRELGQYTGAKLVSMTHQPETPWSNAMASGSTILDSTVLTEYFTKHPLPHLEERISVPKVNTLPADWYNPEEDAEWEAYL